MANPAVITQSADFGRPNVSLGADNLMGTITPLAFSALTAPVEGIHFGVLAHAYVRESPNILQWHVLIGGTGALSAINVVLEGSDDNTNWYNLDTSTTVGGEARFVTGKKAPYLRLRLVSFTVGSGAPTILGTILI